MRHSIYKLCSKCEVFEARPNQRWCRTCHAEQMREQRQRQKKEVESLRKISKLWRN